MNTSLAARASALLLILSTACTPASQSSQEGAASAATPNAKGAATVQRTGDSAAVAACAPLLDVLAACAAQPRCDADMMMYLPAAARSSLIAAERHAAFSEEDFDRYCQQACKAQTPIVDEAAFVQNVCAVAQVAAGPGEGQAGSQPPAVVAFAIRGKLRISEEGLPLEEVRQALGAPEEDSATPFECGSAFSEGDIRQLRYPGFVLETDGSRAVVRSTVMNDGNRLILSSGEELEQINEDHFQRLFGERAEHVGEFYRIGASGNGNWETAYDFYFENGQLARVDYWIGC